MLPQVIGAKAAGKVVVAHLGNGASMCAMCEGRSLATTMGFTALDGLMMGTRCGDLDPGAVLHSIEEKGMTAAQVSDMLYRRSGLLGVSGVSPDVRELAASADPGAADAIELFIYRIVRELGSLVAALGGLDARIGEHSADIRQRVCAQCRWLGIELDVKANDAHQTQISTAQSAVSVWMTPTNEELVIAEAVARMLPIKP